MSASTVLVGLVLVIQLGVNGKDILFQLFVADVLKLQGLDGIGEETARALEHRIGIAHQVDELGVGEHLDQLFHAARVGRILAQELSAVRIP